MAALTATSRSASLFNSVVCRHTSTAAPVENAAAPLAPRRSYQISAVGTSSAPGLHIGFGRRSQRKIEHVVYAAADETSAEGYDAELAGEDDVGVSDVEPTIEESVMSEVSTVVSDIFTGTEELKQGLIDSLYGTERGLKASSETRAEISELITQLEAANPTPATTEAAEVLNGKWILAYTSFSELYPLLAAGNLPFVTVGEISQTINTTAGVLSNQVTFSGPVASSTFTTEASFEIRSPKRLQVKFEETVISAPKMSDSVEMPASIEVFGRRVDLAPFEGVVKPLQEAAAGIVRAVSGQPPLKVPIRGDASSWLLTTYLDKDLRISRGDGGGLFVLIKEGSPLLSY